MRHRVGLVLLAATTSLACSERTLSPDRAASSITGLDAFKREEALFTVHAGQTDALTVYTNTCIVGRVGQAACRLGSARRDVRAFPADARRRTGFQLRRVQQGLDPDDWKPMATVGPGVREIRIHTELAHRVFYLATFDEAVYVLHAFEKRTRKAPPHEFDAGARALPRTAQETSE